MLHDPNDEEFQEAMKYLALPADEKLKLRSQPFDAKKACWVSDPKESYIAAEIESTNGDQVTVKTCKGDVSIFSRSLRRLLFSLGENTEKGRCPTNESSEILLF
jgi:hypothetical protein